MTHLLAEDAAGGSGTALVCKLALKTKEDTCVSKSCLGSVSAMTTGGRVLCLTFLDALDFFQDDCFFCFDFVLFSNKPYHYAP